MTSTASRCGPLPCVCADRSNVNRGSSERQRQRKHGKGSSLHEGSFGFESAYFFNAIDTSTSDSASPMSEATR